MGFKSALGSTVLDVGQEVLQPFKSLTLDTMKIWDGKGWGGIGRNSTNQS
jgi:hypothetical protein